MKHTAFFLLSIFFLAPLHPVVIIVHGTYAITSTWCRPGGAFFDELEKQAEKEGEVVVPFSWSGKNSHKARIRGAESLAKLLLSYPKKEKITILGHSHGGNIINLVSQMIHQAKLGIMSEETPELELFIDPSMLSPFEWDHYSNQQIMTRRVLKMCTQHGFKLVRI